MRTRTPFRWTFALGASGQVANYDGDLLARARAYEGVPVQASLWSLKRASDDWMEAFSLAVDKRVVLLTRNGENRARSMSRAAMLTMFITTSGISAGPWTRRLRQA